MLSNWIDSFNRCGGPITRIAKKQIMVKIWNVWLFVTT